LRSNAERTPRDRRGYDQQLQCQSMAEPQYHNAALPQLSMVWSVGGTPTGF
jgi:hypothetical protein